MQKPGLWCFLNFRTFSPSERVRKCTENVPTYPRPLIRYGMVFRILPCLSWHLTATSAAISSLTPLDTHHHLTFYIWHIPTFPVTQDTPCSSCCMEVTNDIWNTPTSTICSLQVLRRDLEIHCRTTWWLYCMCQARKVRGWVKHRQNSSWCGRRRSTVRAAM